MRNLLKQVAQPQEHRSTFIYALVDPRNQTMRYIGKSVRPKTRFSEHLSQSSLKVDTYKNHWIKSLLRLGLKPELEIIDEVDYRDDWSIEEKRWIARIRNLAPGYPNLTNVSDGGEGIEGCVMPEEIRKKISQANRGVPKSAETRIQFSNGQRNRWKNAAEEDKQKLLRNLRNPQTIERREQSSKRARNATRPASTVSQYRNVVKDNQRGEKCWRAGCIINGKQICVGYFYTEKEAARARDQYVLKHIGEDVILNFPRSTYPQNPSDITIERAKRCQIIKHNSSGYKGVSKNGKNGWAAGISCAGVRYRLGTYRTREEAAHAYDRKAIELFEDRAILNFPRSHYQ
jgi:hypothetical protein